MKQLTAVFVRTVKESGKYGDQHGLILRVSPSGSKQWIWRGTVRGKRRDLGLGGYPYTSLADARELAFEYRKLARSGGDPATLRRNTAAPSFAEACERAIEVRAPSWKDGSKSANNWRSTLGRFAYPRLGDMSIAEITSEDVLAVVLPVWQTRRETARKLKGRISAVMAWAIAEGHRSDDPTAAVGRALPATATKSNTTRRCPTATSPPPSRPWQPPAPGQERSSPSASSSSQRPAAAKSAAPAGTRSTATPNSGPFPPSAPRTAAPTASRSQRPHSTS